jgi:drug/metabolite transporter (DMT)-like permease
MPAPVRSPAVGVVIVLVAASLFGMLGPLSRFAYDAGMQPLAFVAWRAGIACLATTAFVAWRIARRGERLVRLGDLDNGARLSLGAAALAGFTLNLCMFIAFDRITVALALLGFYTYPVMVAVANVALGRERLDRPRVLALALAVAGMVAVVASQLDPSAGIRFDVIGIALTLGAASSQAVFVLVSRHGYRTVPADQGIAVVLAVTVACCVALAAATGAVATLVYPFEAPSVAPILSFTGLVAAAIPSMLFLTGIRLLGGTTAGILMLFEPVVGVALAAWLLAEGLAPAPVLGGLAILAAAVILQRTTKPTEPVLSAAAVEPVTLEPSPFPTDDGHRPLRGNEEPESA